MSSSEPSAEEAPGPQSSPPDPEPELLDADGRERPTFLLQFPKDPALAPLIAAFERGDFRFVRANAERVAESATESDVKQAALELRKRIDPDPLVLKLLFSAVGLFLFLVAWSYFGH